MSQDEWVEYCSGAEEPPIEDGEEFLEESPEPPVDEMLPFGEPFLFLATSSDGNRYESEITLTEVECGLKTVEGAIPSNGSDSEEKPYLAAEAPDGKDFCVAYWTQENVGKVPNDLDGAGDIMLGGTRVHGALEGDES